MQMYGGFWRSESRHLLLSLVFLHVSSKSILAWRAVRPRRWRREPHLLALSPVQQKYLSQEGYTVRKSACRNSQSASLLSDSGLVMYKGRWVWKILEAVCHNSQSARLHFFETAQKEIRRFVKNPCRVVPPTTAWRTRKVFSERTNRL